MDLLEGVQGSCYSTTKSHAVKVTLLSAVLNNDDVEPSEFLYLLSLMFPGLVCEEFLKILFKAPQNLQSIIPFHYKTL